MFADHYKVIQLDLKENYIFLSSDNKFKSFR